MLRTIRRTSIALGSLAACLLAPAVSHGTVLTFDGTYWFEGRVAPDSYGSFVTGNTGSFVYGPECDITPDVQVDYVGTMRWKDVGYGDLQGFLHADHPNNATQRFMSIVMANVSGGTVALHSFDLAAESDEALQVDWVRVYRDGVIAYNNPTPLIPNLGRLSIMFDPPIVGTLVMIELNMTRLSFKSEQIGIDNIKFSQPGIPSPGVGALAAAGLGLLAFRRRR